ncbi:MAG: hypothetical protein CMC38_07815 [Flavobacteriaceae bacterium]|nr:hypothetical protein [Flavobacteriaceae bacterium]|tara:strand:+ start:3214 stop:3681 length:468 start_codon:yes stop_codon:yes gene_type:complete
MKKKWHEYYIVIIILFFTPLFFVGIFLAFYNKGFIKGLLLTIGSYLIPIILLFSIRMIGSQEKYNETRLKIFGIEIPNYPDTIESTRGKDFFKSEKKDIQSNCRDESFIRSKMSQMGRKVITIANQGNRNYIVTYVGKNGETSYQYMDYSNNPCN